MTRNGKIKVLLIGNGGREHALAWKLSQSSRGKFTHMPSKLGNNQLLIGAVSHIYVAPGNGGTAQGIAKAENIPIQVDDFASLVNFAQVHGINLVVPGPEAPLVSGVTDYFKNSMSSTQNELHCQTNHNDTYRHTQYPSLRPK